MISSLNIHDAEAIEIGPAEPLDCDVYTRHLRVRGPDGCVDITIYARSAEALEIREQPKQEKS